MRCSIGQTWESSDDSCSGTISNMSWESALQTASTSTLLGKSDWRLPNIKELTSLVERACYDPAINETLFPDMDTLSNYSNYYWTSSAFSSFSSYAWIVQFNVGFGSSSYRYNNNKVRLVRGG